jgi:hypothetical protein
MIIARPHHVLVPPVPMDRNPVLLATSGARRSVEIMCVIPTERSQVAYDNSQAIARIIAL